MEANSSSENWVITFISVPLAAAAGDISGFQGVYMPCGCLGKGEVFKVAGSDSPNPDEMSSAQCCQQVRGFQLREGIFKPEKYF